MHGLRLRYLGPFLLVTLCLVLLCTFTAISLLHQQAAVTKVFKENVASRKAAVELEQCLADLLALENAENEDIAVLHERVESLLRGVEAAADQPEEVELY